METLLPLLSRYGYGVLLLGAMLEGEVTIVLAGVLAQQGILSYPWVVLVAAVGTLASDQVWFNLGRHYEPAVLARFPRLARHLDSLRPWVDERADWIATAFRFTYGTRVVSPLLLGMHGYAATRFLLIGWSTGLVWVVATATAGYLMGASAGALLGELVRVEWLLLGAAAVILGWHWLRRRKSKHRLARS